MTTDTPESDCGEPAPYDVGLCVLLAEHVGWHRASDGTEWVTGNQSGIVDVVADMTDYVDQLRVQLARVTQERDQALADAKQLVDVVLAARVLIDQNATPIPRPMGWISLMQMLDRLGATPEVPNAH